ncbi:MAG: P-type conjugative transfer ATPase TrbB [Sulfurovum sp.]|nr:P-type conjugative transfer ATPase TrbB [Sulfurovum sp.]
MQLTDTQKRLHTKIKAELGREVIAALEDDEIIEIMLNSDNSLWVDRLATGIEKIEKHTCSAQAAIHTIASYLDTNITTNNPVLECNLPIDGSRFEAIIPPIVEKPSFTIRKKAKRIFTLEEYEKAGSLNKTDLVLARTEIPDGLTPKEILEFAVANKKNILISGGTSSGKTTLTNALIDKISELSPDDRLVIIEDALEIQCKSKNNVIFRSNRFNANQTIMRLLAVTMRYRPDRILVGEVRGKEAHTLLDSWNTGHPGGICTLHADTAYLTLTRLESLVAQSEESRGLDIKNLIGEAVDIVINIAKTKSKAGRNIQEIIEVKGYDPLNQKYNIRRLI